MASRSRGGATSQTMEWWASLSLDGHRCVVQIRLSGPREEQDRHCGHSSFWKCVTTRTKTSTLTDGSGQRVLQCSISSDVGTRRDPTLFNARGCQSIHSGMLQSYVERTHVSVFYRTKYLNVPERVTSIVRRVQSDA